MIGLKKALEQYGRARANAPLARFSSFNIGGPAEFFVEVVEQEKLVGLLNFISGLGIDWFILGGGSNVLFPDEGLPGVTIHNAVKESKVDGNKLSAAAGMVLADLVRISIEKGLTGLEWAAGIPGTLGGAVRGNAGARYAFAGGEIKDNASSVAVWRGGEVIPVPNAECEFSYRNSAFKHNKDVVISADFELLPGDRQTSLQIVQKILLERRGKHAAEPSAGSFFKNVFLSDWKADPKILPPRFLDYKKIAAGWLIEQAGLKGYRSGNAMVSLSHANFIINCGGATQHDVLQVVERVVNEVYNRFGIQLEEEVQIVK